VSSKLPSLKNDSSGRALSSCQCTSLLQLTSAIYISHVMSSHFQRPSFLLTLSLLPLSDVSFAFSPWQENDSGGRALSSCQRTSLLQLTSAIFRFLMSCHPTSIISSCPFPFTVEWRVFTSSCCLIIIPCHVMSFHIIFSTACTLIICIVSSSLHPIDTWHPAVCLKLSGSLRTLSMSFTCLLLVISSPHHTSVCSLSSYLSSRH
jgi:hypothetical protein